MSDKKFISGRALQIVLIALFLALSLLPSLGMIVFGPSESSANEILASKPAIIAKDGRFNKNILSDVSDYIADRFAFRQSFVTAWSRLNAAVFRSSAEEQVVLGKNGWLYYTPSVDDYMGRAMSVDELKHAAAYLASLQQTAESRGAAFVFTIAPNKNSLYAQNMPSYIPEDHNASNAERLKPWLDEYGVNYVDLFSVFSERGEVLYYRTDSHWTERGAALAADALLQAADRPSSYFDGPFAAGEGHRGDLYEMLYPKGKELEENELYMPGFSYTLRDDPNGGNAMRIRSLCDGRDGTLLCWRDSFGISLYPYLADSFGSATFLRSANYDPAMIDKTGASVVLVEIVERNLTQLAEAEIIVN